MRLLAALADRATPGQETLLLHLETEHEQLVAEFAAAPGAVLRLHLRTTDPARAAAAFAAGAAAIGEHAGPPSPAGQAAIARLLGTPLTMPAVRDEPLGGPPRSFAPLLIAGAIATFLAGALVSFGGGVREDRLPPSPVASAPTTVTPTPSPSPDDRLPSESARLARPGTRLTAAPGDPSRITISGTGIDIAILPGANPDRPRCNVAEYLPEFGRPEDPTNRSWTFIYAHGRPGMFGPLVTASDARLRDATVRIWTGDGRRIEYAVERVINGATNVSVLSGLDPDVVILQTCETADGAGPKRYLILRLRSVTSDPEGATPLLPATSC